MKIVIGRISPIQRLSVYYRSTAPGHPACEERSTPYNNTLTARAAEKHIVPRLKAQVPSAEVKQQRARWDWDLFEVHNELWRWTVGRLAREREWMKLKVGVELGAKWYYLDLWDLNLQRADAHSEPGQDCLHCMWIKNDLPLSRC